MSIGKTALLILALAISEFSAGGTARAQEALPANAKAQNLGPLAYTLDARLIPAVNAVRAAASTDAQAALDIKSAHGRALAPTAQAEHLAIRIDAPVNDALLAQIRAAGAVVTHSAPQWNTVCATATVSQIDALTRIEAVRSIMLQAGKRRHQQGSTANQGDGVMNADKVRATFGVTGKGQKIGVISDSVTDTSAVRGNSYKVSGSVPNAAVTGTVPQGTGDLPPSFQVVDFGPGQGTDEGELIMEVIYDVAPGAALAFASAGNDQTAMASNLLALRTEANCTITVDDIAFFDEPFFQDGPIAQAVTTNFNASVLLFSAIGNDGANGILTTYNPINSTVDDLQDPPSGNCFHNWGIGTATPSFLPIFLPAGDELIVILQWNQPYQSYGLGSGSQADLDLYLYATNSTSGRVLSKSATPQGKAGSPSGDPYEIIDYVNMGGDRTVYLALNHYQGVRGNVMRLVVSDVSGGTLSFPAGGVNGISAYGHPTTQACIGVGAIFWQDAQNNILRPESYSSEGGMGAAGVPYYFDTSGKALAGAPVTVSTPLIVAPDGVDTSLQTDFLGTSCAAPNAAAVAALLLQAAPGTSPAKLTAVLKSSATDCTAAPASPGPDAFTGWGLINALAAAQALSVASPAPSIT
ncbi:MAG: S8 family serine peptidase, partial [Planctomycetota bacterium]